MFINVNYLLSHVFLNILIYDMSMLLLGILNFMSPSQIRALDINMLFKKKNINIC